MSQRLRDAQPGSVLFVCLGNICRSPYAEHVFRSRVGDGVEASSAGFILPGRQPPENALEVAATRGVSTTDHRSQVVSEDLLRGSDAVFIFDRFNAQRLRKLPSGPRGRVYWLGDFDPEWTGKRAIIDPWGKPAEEFDRTFARIERCIDRVTRVLSDEERGRATGGTP
ncbi:MAG: low molecular weight phosphotyrosine protein phosphatase [Gemmatimonadetes bacterium]|nr:low molecular weight phosphotyrosine protein phosphatase [Gemmatimonadota bacterium]NNL31444.1 low molecular weight phosphotyrosine protein phosphatase [Gemmatimonadota bacterium]